MGVVHEHVVDRISVFADCHGLEAEAVLHEALGIVLSEEHLLAVAEKDGVLGAVFLVGEI